MDEPQQYYAKGKEAWDIGRQYYFYKMSRIDKFIETKSKLVVNKGWGRRDREGRISFGEKWKYFGTKQRWWLHNLVDVWNVTETYTLKLLLFPVIWISPDL